jgi:hypothetical protein
MFEKSFPPQGNRASRRKCFIVTERAVNIKSLSTRSEDGNMKKLYGVTLLTLLLLSFTTMSHASVLREYQTNYGIMTLTFSGSDVNGSYTYQGGQISGTLEGRTMRCTWKQNNGSGNCIATFSNNFDRIDLKWNYAGATGWKGDWGGTLRR